MGVLPAHSLCPVLPFVPPPERLLVAASEVAEWLGAFDEAEVGSWMTSLGIPTIRFTHATVRFRVQRLHVLSADTPCETCAPSLEYKVRLARLKKWRSQRVRTVRFAEATGRAPAAAVADRWAYFGGRCWMCGEPATSTDHVIPISRGGARWPSNLRPACVPCNSRKCDRPAPRWSAPRRAVP